MKSYKEGMTIQALITLPDYTGKKILQGLFYTITAKNHQTGMAYLSAKDNAADRYLISFMYLLTYFSTPGPGVMAMWLEDDVTLPKGNAPIGEPKHCHHTYSWYTGLKEQYEYCTKCGRTREDIKNETNKVDLPTKV